MEARFGHDFGAVRIHADARAAASAAALGALAYTVGPHIVFGAGRYAPGSAEGRALLAHELAHTIQQQGANAGDASVLPADAPAEREADRAAVAAATGRRVALTPGPSRVALQRSGNLKAIGNWSYVAYEKEVRLIYYEAAPKSDDPYAEAEGAKKPRPVQIGTIPWVTNNPGNITVDPKAEARRQAVSVAGATLPAPGSIAGGVAAESMETLQTVPYRIGATATYKGRYAVFATPGKGREAILPYLRAIARFRNNPDMTVADALKTFKGQEPNEGPEVREKYVQDIRSFMIESKMSAADVDALLSRKVSEVLDKDTGTKQLVAGLARKEGSMSRPGVVFNCNGFELNTRSLYDAREWGLIQALKSSVPANDELRGILACK